MQTPIGSEGWRFAHTHPPGHSLENPQGEAMHAPPAVQRAGELVNAAKANALSHAAVRIIRALDCMGSPGSGHTPAPQP